jgi:glycine cleavage system H lipoate-binding protein
VNRDPYGAGWLIVIAMAAQEVDGLLTATQYEEHLKTAGDH